MQRLAPFVILVGLLFSAGKSPGALYSKWDYVPLYGVPFPIAQRFGIDAILVINSRENATPVRIPGRLGGLDMRLDPLAFATTCAGAIVSAGDPAVTAVAGTVSLFAIGMGKLMSSKEPYFTPSQPMAVDTLFDVEMFIVVPENGYPVSLYDPKKDRSLLNVTRGVLEGTPVVPDFVEIHTDRNFEIHAIRVFTQIDGGPRLMTELIPSP